MPRVATSASRLALGALPPEQIELIRLAFFAGLSHGEIAYKTGFRSER
jgi:DNA-directed RNA polymerase specialized sigma24 family protein